MFVNTIMFIRVRIQISMDHYVNNCICTISITHKFGCRVFQFFSKIKKYEVPLQPTTMVAVAAILISKNQYNFMLNT